MKKILWLFGLLTLLLFAENNGSVEKFMILKSFDKSMSFADLASRDELFEDFNDSSQLQDTKAIYWIKVELSQTLKSTRYMVKYKGELDDFIDLDTICEGVYDTIEQEEPVEEEVIEEPVVEEVPEVSTVVANDIKELAASENEEKKTVVMDSVFFAYKSTELADEAKEHLKYVAKYLQDQNNTKLIIYGHSDSIGSAKYNKKLSLERAENVKKELIILGISADRIEAIGIGESQPIADNSTVAGREKNRRIEFEIVRPKKIQSDNNSTKEPENNIEKIVENLENNSTQDAIPEVDEKFDIKVSKEPVEQENNQTESIDEIENVAEVESVDEISENNKSEINKPLTEDELLKMQTEAEIQKNIELEMSEDDIEVQ